MSHQFCRRIHLLASPRSSAYLREDFVTSFRSSLDPRRLSFLRGAKRGIVLGYVYNKPVSKLKAGYVMTELSGSKGKYACN